MKTFHIALAVASLAALSACHSKEGEAAKDVAEGQAANIDKQADAVKVEGEIGRAHV